MDTTQKDQPAQPQVSVPVGRTEGPPVAVSPDQSGGSVESIIEHGPEFAPEPQVHPEAGEFVQPVQTPRLDKAAQNAGMVESIPNGPVFGNLPTDQHIAQQTFKSGDSGSANTWRAIIAIKEFAKGLFVPKRPQEVS